MVERTDESLLRRINLDAQVQRFEAVEKLRFKMNLAEAELRNHAGEIHPDDFSDYAMRTDKILQEYDEKRKKRNL